VLNEPDDFKLITGPMKAGKSKELIKLVNEMKQRENKAVFTLTHSFKDEFVVDVTSRSEEVDDIKAANMLKYGSLHELMNYVLQADLLKKHGYTSIALIDEVQFATIELLEYYKKMHDEHGIEIIFFAISEDFKQEIFPSIQWLIDNGVKVETLKANCDLCKAKNKGTRNIRLSEDNDLFVEDKDIYKTVCEKCLEKHK